MSLEVVSRVVSLLSTRLLCWNLYGWKLKNLWVQEVLSFTVLSWLPRSLNLFFNYIITSFLKWRGLHFCYAIKSFSCILVMLWLLIVGQWWIWRGENRRFLSLCSNSLSLGTLKSVLGLMVGEGVLRSCCILGLRLKPGKSVDMGRYVPLRLS